MPGPTAQAVPLQGAGVRDQPEGFNSVGGTATVNEAAYDLTFFQHYGVNPFIDTEDDNRSTFAIDVDTASYTVARRFVQDGNLPDPASVWAEEFINYFDQGYASPTDGDAFAIHLEGSPSPFGSERHCLVRVGLQGRTVAHEARRTPPSSSPSTFPAPWPGKSVWVWSSGSSGCWSARCVRRTKSAS